MRAHSLSSSIALALLIHLAVFVFYQAKKPMPQTPAPSMQVLLKTTSHKAAEIRSAKPSKQHSIKQAAIVAPAPQMLEPISEAGQAINQLISPNPKLDLSIPKDENLNTKHRPHTGLDPQAETPRSALAKSLDKAVKPDCKQAYSSMGVLAAAPLIYDALSERGCAW
jgi:hypothetical protein